jgi:hypothetical protein
MLALTFGLIYGLALTINHLMRRKGSRLDLYFFLIDGSETKPLYSTRIMLYCCGFYLTYASTTDYAIAAQWFAVPVRDSVPLVATGTLPDDQ